LLRTSSFFVFLFEGVSIFFLNSSSILLLFCFEVAFHFFLVFLVWSKLGCMPKISFLASLEVALKFKWGGGGVVVQLITLSTPARVEVELG
jgi:hypothetical protein